MLLLVFIRNLFEIYDLGPDVFCNLFQFKFPEVGQFDLNLAAGDGHDPEHRLLGPLSDLHSFPHIDLEHTFSPLFHVQMVELLLTFFDNLNK